MRGRIVPIEHLPERVKPGARRVRDWALSIGPALIILGVGALARGVSYTPWLMSETAQRAHPVEGILPMGVWAWIWIAAGAAAMVAAWWPRIAPVAVGAGVGLNLVWGCSFVADAFMRDSARGWLPAVGYLSISVLVLWAVWRGAREPTVSREEIAHELRRG